MLENPYTNIQNYVKHLLDKQKVKLEVRVITNELFIEKIQFMITENEKPINIMMELLDRSDLTDLVRTFKSAYLNESLVPLHSRFFYTIKEGKALIYLIWKDKQNNIIFVDGGSLDNISILSEGDTFSLQ